MKTINRRHMLHLIGLSVPVAAQGASLATLMLSGCDVPKKDSAMAQELTSTTPNSTQRMPVLFVGHGSPMHAIDDNVWSRGFAELASKVPLPKAILSVSAHWYGPGTMLTGNPQPRTIHDFGAFPQALFDVLYPAPGSPTLAAKVRKMIGEERAQISEDWGLDHGTWSVLKHMFPKANIPVIQLSINSHLAPAQHLALAQSLRELREDGVLVFGSGNITHNLPHAMTQMRSGGQAIPPWSQTFDTEIVTTLDQRDSQNLSKILETDHGRMSHPTPDHYLPLMYAFGATADDDKMSYPIDGFDLGLSMRSVLWT
jgi:4,5-DOPA dioxygenase extradiol